MEEKRMAEQKALDEKNGAELRAQARAEDALVKTAAAAAAIDAARERQRKTEQEKTNADKETAAKKTNSEKIEHSNPKTVDNSEERDKTEEKAHSQEAQEYTDNDKKTAFVIKQEMRVYRPYEKDAIEKDEEKIIAVCDKKEDIKETAKDYAEPESSYGDFEQREHVAFKAKEVPIYESKELQEADKNGEIKDEPCRNVVFSETETIDEKGVVHISKAPLGISAGITQEEADFVSQKMISYYKENRTIAENGDDNADPTLDAKESFNDIREAELENIKILRDEERMEKEFENDYDRDEDEMERSME